MSWLLSSWVKEEDQLYGAGLFLGVGEALGAGTDGTLGDTRIGEVIIILTGEAITEVHIGAGMVDGVIITQYHTKEEEQTEDYITATMEDLEIEMV